MNVLLVAPAFYDYHRHIVSEFERRGHSVTFRTDRPARWIYSPARRLPRRMQRMIFDAHLRGILRSARRETFDLVILINGKIATSAFVEALRAAQPKARFVMYQWDGLKEVDYRPLLSLFDAAATFDPVDAQRLGIGYLPTFYVPPYRLSDAPEEPEWDLVFVASYNETRYRSLQRISDLCERQGIRFNCYLYIAPLDFLKLALLSRDAPARKDVRFRKIAQADVLAMYRNAAAVLDIEDLKQSGLTMRCFEALATGRLLVTTNPQTLKVLPELADRILVIDRDRPEFSREQLRRPPGWSEGLDRYSLKSWVKRLLSL